MEITTVETGGAYHFLSVDTPLMPLRWVWASQKGYKHLFSLDLTNNCIFNGVQRLSFFFNWNFCVAPLQITTAQLL